MSMQQITSHQNKNFKIWRDCLESKGVQTHRRAILAGKKVIIDVLKTHLEVVEAYLVPEKFKLSDFSGLAACKAAGLAGYSLQDKLFKDLDIFGTGHPLLVVKVPEIKKFESPLKGASLFIPFQDPKNVGAVLRSASAFGVNKILLAKSAAHPFHPESLRASSGCVFDHEFFKAELSNLEKFITVGLDMEGESIKDFKFPRDFILVPGIEGQGLSREFNATHRITIPINKNIESLNANVATSIALYEFSKGLNFS